MENEIPNTTLNRSQYIDKVEQLCIDRALQAYRLDNREWGVNVQPYSGSIANIAAYLGIIKLQSKLLEGTEVNITEKKEIYEFEADKLVYNPDNDIVATTGSAEDVLNRAPMVTVDQDGEVQLRGNSNVNILVDGRKNRIDLANISGSQIERVEVITSASAKYDPED